MSDDEAKMEKPFAVEKAKSGRAKCKKCKCPIDKDTVRIAKLMSNPFGDGKMKAWHHVTCLFEVFSRQRASTKKIDDPVDDIDGWEDLSDADREIILDKLEETGVDVLKLKKRPSSSSPGGSAAKKAKTSTSIVGKTSDKSPKKKEIVNEDDKFFNFQRICSDISRVSAYTEKTAIVKKMFKKGSKGDGFHGDMVLWCTMLLPMVNKRIYNLQSKQLVKIFSRILCQSENEMLRDLEQGDVAETIRKFFETSCSVAPLSESVLTLQEVNEFLEQLSQLTKEDDQVSHIKTLIKRCTLDDLKMIIRLIKHDLRINCGPKHILEAVDPEAYRAYQTSNDLPVVLKRFIGNPKDKVQFCNVSTSPTVTPKVSLSLMTPVLPMLAEACKSVEMAIKKCPSGMLSEIKYDGERVQIHKKGNEFRYFSRSLKPVLAHKVNQLKEYIPKAFPNGDDLILDSEILMMDCTTGQPLPFGSLGVHKKAEFKNANVCIFVFDCIYYNGSVLLEKSMKERRRILTQQMTPIPNRVILSESKEIRNPKDLAEMIGKVLKLGLEGLVLKDVNGFYEPGKRHWLKIKKDYLFDGAMADSADLVVLGAWYGTGNKGGMMSIFLMGCYDELQDKWLTVTKVHSGHDDATLSKLQKQLDMVKIGKNQSLVPTWLNANKQMVPDFVARDPKKQPVWEITGAEFTNQGVHTAEGISIRFPRVTRIRHDKDWSTATSLKELRDLYNKKSDSIDLSRLLDGKSSMNNGEIAAIDNQNSSLNNSLDSGDNQLKKHRKNKKTDNESLENSGDGASYYAFIDGDYIEYNSEGSPLNWIEGRKPEQGLPPDAIPLSKSRDAKPRSRGILGTCFIILDDDFSRKQQKILSRTLITLGARVQSMDNLFKITHVIHKNSEITEDNLRKYDGNFVRHVSESWIDSVVDNREIPEESKHAVAIRGSYCNCSCPH